MIFIHNGKIFHTLEAAREKVTFLSASVSVEMFKADDYKISTFSR